MYNFIWRYPISIAIEIAGIAEENLAGSFVMKTLSGTLVDRIYVTSQIMV